MRALQHSAQHPVPMFYVAHRPSIMSDRLWINLSYKKSDKIFGNAILIIFIRPVAKASSRSGDRQMPVQIFSDQLQISSDSQLDLSHIHCKQSLFQALKQYHAFPYKEHHLASGDFIQLHLRAHYCLRKLQVDADLLVKTNQIMDHVKGI